MAETRPLYLGPRLRRLRREMGLTQHAMGEDLEISPSYVALLERNQRPVTADLLLRLARVYGLDIADLANEDGTEYARRIADVLRDPIFADIDLPTLEIADLAMSFPGVSEALLRLHGAYVSEQKALVEQRVSGRGADDSDPVIEVQQFLAGHHNHFPEFDARAEELSEEIHSKGGSASWLAEQGVRVRFVPPGVLVDAVRRFDRHSQQLLLDDTLDAPSRTFQLAAHIAYSAMRTPISQIVRGHASGSKTAEALLRRALAGYGAAALTMPYGRFLRAAEERRYDIAALAGLFGASFEQVAHRLTTLRRADSQGVPFFFVRVDAAGNVSKRFDGAGFPFAAQGGGCPLWTLHSAVRRPGEMLTQWLEMPDGQRFFSIARTVSVGSGQHDRPPILRAVALVCAALDAGRLVYAQGVDPAAVAATPVGVTCRLCHRAECTARAAPPIGREILTDEYRRTVQPFAFAES